MQLDDEMARSVAERELAKGNAARIDNQKKYFESKKKHKTKRYRDEIDSEESEEEQHEEYRKTQIKKRFRVRKAKARRMRKKKSLIERRKRRLKKKLIKFLNTFRKNQNNLNLCRVSRIQIENECWWQCHGEGRAPLF